MQALGGADIGLRVTINLMMRESTNYYDVALALPANWDSNVFTYESRDSLKPGSIVKAPFGKTSKIGYVLSRTDMPARPTKVLQAIENNLKLPTASLELVSWLQKNYPLLPGDHIQHVLPSFLSDVSSLSETTDNENGTHAVATMPPDLTTEQKRAVRELRATNDTQILHGITGSGKTRVYLELIREARKNGKNSLILYPEISLSGHVIDYLSEFMPPDSLNVYHSKQTLKQRQHTWLTAAKSKGGKVFAGPRSALFLPYSNLGLIVVDEAHDGSYKQDNGSRYNGLFVAAALARIHGAKLVLGSATPPLQETYFLEAKGIKMVCLHNLAMSSEIRDERTINIVSMKESSNRSRVPLVSKPLLAAVENSLKNGRQSLLFINRRGTARAVLCESCGWNGECRRCDTQLVYHHDYFQLRCHLCGLRQTAPSSCPNCYGELRQKTPGVKALEQDLKKTFPDARIARFDSDNRKADSFHMRYADIKSGGADIIIGTQIITKGLDLPMLETVGVLQAESLLLLPDFSSRERAVQQLMQVSGRVGRGHAAGKVFIQTYNADSPVLREVSAQDWHGFYDDELKVREKTGFPPFKFSLKIWTLKKRESSSVEALEKMAELIKAIRRDIRLLGPAPSFHTKVLGRYSWQLIVLSSSRQALVDIVSELPKGFYFDLDPISFL